MRLSVLPLLALISFASAAPAGWTNNTVKVGSVIWIPSTKGFYAETGTFHNPINCPATELYKLAPTVSDLEASRILAMLLSAKATGSPVNVWYTGDCNTENGSAVYFSGLQVNP